VAEEGNAGNGDIGQLGVKFLPGALLLVKEAVTPGLQNLKHTDP
jgi:hypothetical protein